MLRASITLSLILSCCPVYAAIIINGVDFPSETILLFGPNNHQIRIDSFNDEVLYSDNGGPITPYDEPFTRNVSFTIYGGYSLWTGAMLHHNGGHGSFAGLTLTPLRDTPLSEFRLIYTQHVTPTWTREYYTSNELYMLETLRTVESINVFVLADTYGHHQMSGTYYAVPEPKTWHLGWVGSGTLFVLSIRARLRESLTALRYYRILV